MRLRLPSRASFGLRLRIGARMLLLALMALGFALFALIDAGLCQLWPAWREREGLPRRFSLAFVRGVRALFPLFLVVPCSREPRYRVVHSDLPRTLRPGERAQVRIGIQNLSGESWRGGLCLGVVFPLEGSALYVANAWHSPACPAALAEGVVVRPGEVATFDVAIRAPEAAGRLRETWALIVPGRNWTPTLRGVGVSLRVRAED